MAQVKERLAMEVDERRRIGAEDGLWIRGNYC